MKEVQPTGDIKRVGICGAGTMGSGIAQVAAQAGAQVKVFDVDPASLARGKQQIDDALNHQVSRGKLPASDRNRICAAISWTGDLQHFADNNLTIEAVVEDLEVKHTLFKQLESIVAPGSILASNTSSLSIARIARALTHPERFIGMHFFNPAPVMKLVEVVSGPATDPGIHRQIVQAASTWGKIAVPVADVPGFIVNRVARPFYAEAFCAWQQGAAEPALIDHLFRASAGFRMGPLELTDLIGQDVNFAVARSVFDGYFGVTRFTPQLGQATLVDAGWLGRKTGRGVYDYRDGAPPVPEPTPFVANALIDVLAEPDAVLPGMTPIAVGGALIGLTRGVPAQSEAAREGRPVAVLDWFDPGRASAVGFAASDDTAADAAAALIKAVGKSPYRMADRPGLVVMRTLAQIANAAGDAVLERVSDEAGIDIALRHGANYPFGPFAWADMIGRGALAMTLSNIEQETGLKIYAASEYWRRYLDGCS